MQSLKVFYADDHLPITDEYNEFNSENYDEIYRKLKKRYSSWNEKELVRMRNVYYNASLALKILAPAYELTKINHYQEALELAGSIHFDIAIIDIGWKNDKDFPKKFDGKAEDAGWNICRAIKEADKKLNSRPTLLIAYSSRFVELENLSGAALAGGALPFFKASLDAEQSAIKANVSALNAVVNFLATNLSKNTPIEEILQQTVKDLHKMKLEAFKETQNDRQIQQRSWYKSALLGSIASVILVVIGVIGAFFWNVQVGTVTAIIGALPTLMSGIFYARLDSAQKTMAKSQKELDLQFEDVLNKLLILSMKSTQETDLPQP